MGGKQNVDFLQKLGKICEYLFSGHGYKHLLIRYEIHVHLCMGGKQNVDFLQKLGKICEYLQSGCDLVVPSSTIAPYLTPIRKSQYHKKTQSIKNKHLRDTRYTFDSFYLQYLMYFSLNIIDKIIHSPLWEFCIPTFIITINQVFFQSKIIDILIQTIGLLILIIYCIIFYNLRLKINMNFVELLLNGYNTTTFFTTTIVYLNEQTINHTP
eukprot:TRINITY_DN3323_c0_g1_i6.p1 TRINITY_DN3323_c0_g1~~TRINITY_DN3323_c0_g1_i6.p1  ORF type:complete len:211 (+),score=-9.52 TRINITY_DN3323_c0_g1_i6:162-794(+)